MKKKTLFVRKFNPNDKVAYCGKIFRVTRSEPQYLDWSRNLFYRIHRGQTVLEVRADRLNRVRG